MKPLAWMWCLLWRGHTPIRVIDEIADLALDIDRHGVIALDYRVVRAHEACQNCGRVLG